VLDEWEGANLIMAARIRGCISGVAYLAQRSHWCRGIAHVYLDTILLLFVDLLCSYRLCGIQTAAEKVCLSKVSLIISMEKCTVSGRSMLNCILHATAGTSAEFLASDSASCPNNTKSAKPRSAAGVPEIYIQ
jgi:hypothetical protein